MKKSDIAIIGSGFAGLAAAAVLANEGHDLTIYEKNDQAGGRARVWESEGFTFDMGPSWYWMPEVFENFYNLFGKTTSDFYDLKRLDPSYRVYWEKNNFTDLPAQHDKLEELFEAIEPGSALKLREFLKQAKFKYETGMGDYVFRPSNSIKEYMDLRLLKESFKIQLFTSINKHLRQYFKHPKLLKLLEFPVLFLGGTAENTPALYSLMNYADLSLGTWFPIGGMNEIVKAMLSIAQEKGVKIKLDHEVLQIKTEGKKAIGIETNAGYYKADLIISNADYWHTDQQLTAEKNRNYSPGYWDKRVLSPSSLLFYVGINKKLDNIIHHNLFFDQDLEKHAHEIYKDPKWPTKPLFYVSCTSKTNESSAPLNSENLFFLMPLAPGLEDTDALREKYWEILLNRFEEITGESIRHNIVTKRAYAIKDFVKDYNSFKGNAYGLANTLMQTAFLKPKMRSKKITNLLFTGQLTVPGPGVPPAIISGQVAANEALKILK